MRTCFALFVALLAGARCGGDGPESPIRKTIGSPVVSGPLTRTPIEFTTTESGFRPTVVRAEEGRLRVPERHGDPAGRTIEVHFVRFPAEAKNAEPPIVYLAGGPGGSGTWSAAGDRFPLFQVMREVADVVAYDQRGTWGTDPYTVCPGAWSYPLDRPWEVATLREAIAPYLEQCAAHWGGRADLTAYNTVESAEDLEALRVALGAEKLTLWGISYGTHLALAYIRAHPDRVHRAILAGVEGPDDTWKMPSRIDAALERVAEAIRADPQARAAIPDFRGALRQRIAQLEREPATVEVKNPATGAITTVVVGANDLRNAVYSAMDERGDLAALLERGLPVLRGDFTNVALFALSARLDNRGLAMSLSMDCASGLTANRAAAIAEQEKTAVLGSQNDWLRAACPQWPAADLGDAFRSPVVSDVPVLFISGTLDPRTPPENAEEVLAGFRNGRHLVIEGASHDDDLLLPSPQIADSMLRFLRGGEPMKRIRLAPIRFALP